jgi:hypothetical protein
VAPFFAVVVFFVEGFFVATDFFVVAAFFDVVCVFFAKDVYFFDEEPVVFGREVVPPDFFSETVLFFGTVRTEGVFFTATVFAEVVFGLVVEDFFVDDLIVFVVGLVFYVL